MPDFNSLTRDQLQEVEGQLSDLRLSPGWGVVRGYLEDQLHQSRRSLESVDMPLDCYRLQGKVKAFEIALASVQELTQQLDRLVQGAQGG